MTALVHLTRGYQATVDSEDADRVLAHRWCVCIANGKTPYAVRGFRGKTEYLHRFILNAAPDQRVDHRSGDTLDCRRSNLRIATLTQNNQNRGKTRSATTSHFKGVQLRPTGLWQARIGLRGEQIVLGSFPSEESAALAYDGAAGWFYGEFARLNFPGGAQ